MPNHGLCRQVRERADSDCPVSISSLGSNSVRLEDGARVGQIRAAIAEQRTLPQRAAATVSRARTGEGLMSQKHFEETKTRARSSPCSRPSHGYHASEGAAGFNKLVGISAHSLAAQSGPLAFLSEPLR